METLSEVENEGVMDGDVVEEREGVNVPRDHETVPDANERLLVPVTEGVGCDGEPLCVARVWVCVASAVPVRLVSDWILVPEYVRVPGLGEMEAVPPLGETLPELLAETEGRLFVADCDNGLGLEDRVRDCD